MIPLYYFKISEYLKIMKVNTQTDFVIEGFVTDFLLPEK
jgi:hypothetical protein